MSVRAQRVRYLVVLLLALCSLASSELFANKAAKFQEEPNLFPESPLISSQVKFWEAVFSQYPGSSYLLHDVDNPELIIDLIDFKNLEERGRNKSFRSERYRELFIERYLKRYELALRRFRIHGAKAVKFGAIEQRVFNVYKQDRSSLQLLYAGQVEIRNQKGLSDEFDAAAKRASSYFPQMEKIFRSKGIPPELTRMVFVESMFNTRAVSKVGASGVWQFMPKTAKEFMFVNHVIDERNSPLKATRAAARMLAKNYEVLKTWPLAITAYNHGRGSMSNAVKTLGTRDYDKILRNYKRRSYGFASKNFYAEFLAARRVYNSVYRPRYLEVAALDVTPIVLNQQVSLAQLIKHTPLDQKTLKKHNPCLLTSSFQGNLYRKLPKNYEIYVPTKMYPSVNKAISKIHFADNKPRTRNYGKSL
jgi:membrane-bound lytic murein transglycosylase D